MGIAERLPLWSLLSLSAMAIHAATEVGRMDGDDDGEQRHFGNVATTIVTKDVRTERPLQGCCYYSCLCLLNVLGGSVEQASTTRKDS